MHPINQLTVVTRTFILGILLLPFQNTATAQSEDSTFHPSHWFRFHRKPTITLLYGFSTPSHDGVRQSLAHQRVAELQLGGIRIDSLDDAPFVLKYENTFATLSYIANDIGGTSSISDLRTSQWRFGLAWSKGYGYDFGRSEGESFIIGYRSVGMQWSRLKLLDQPTLSPDADVLALYDGSFRFGTMMEAGLIIKPIPLMAINASFERSVLFERHLFWKWAGSVVLHEAGEWLLDKFISRVEDSSPTAVPIVAFVLKNALSYGVYELRKKSMYAPIASDPPLFNDTFKVGLSFVF